MNNRNSTTKCGTAFEREKNLLDADPEFCSRRLNGERAIR